MNSLARTFFVGLVSLIPVATSASEAERMAALSKSDFVAEYEGYLLQMMEAQQVLFTRFDADMAANVLDMGPITEAEHTSIACLWDKMNEKGELEGLAQQALIANKMTRLTVERPEVDIVDFFMNEEIMDENVRDVSDGLLSSMQECGSMKASEHRVKYSQDLWVAFGAAAQERGYE